MGVTSRAEVWAFGPVAFAVDGRAQPVVGKPGTLLALLAFYGGAPVPQRVAAEAVWDRAALPLDSPRALRQVVRRLSPLLATGGTSVVTTPAGLALDLPADAVDVHRFRHLLQARPIAELGEPSLRAALACWHDDPFPELLHVPEVQVAMDELTSLRLDAVAALNDLELQRAVSYPLVAELERMVRLHPARERLWQQLADGAAPLRPSRGSPPGDRAVQAGNGRRRPEPDHGAARAETAARPTRHRGLTRSGASPRQRPARGRWVP